MKTLREIPKFIVAFVGHWSALITGGVITAGVTVYHFFSKTQVSSLEFGILLCVFFVIAAFWAWQGEHRIAESLRSQIGENSHRKEIKDALGDWHSTIQNLRSDLNIINVAEYRAEKRQQFEADVIRLEDAVSTFLVNRIGRAEAALFNKDPEYPIEPPAVWDDGLKPAREARNKILFRLQHRLVQLETVMGKVDSRDFILPRPANDTQSEWPSRKPL